MNFLPDLGSHVELAILREIVAAACQPHVNDRLKPHNSPLLTQEEDEGLAAVEDPDLIQKLLFDLS